VLLCGHGGGGPSSGKSIGSMSNFLVGARTDFTESRDSKAEPLVIVLPGWTGRAVSAFIQRRRGGQPTRGISAPALVGFGLRFGEAYKLRAWAEALGDGKEISRREGKDDTEVEGHGASWLGLKSLLTLTAVPLWVEGFGRKGSSLVFLPLGDDAPGGSMPARVASTELRGAFSKADILFVTKDIREALSPRSTSPGAMAFAFPAILSSLRFCAVSSVSRYR
jgi:hypothetical protein